MTSKPSAKRGNYGIVGRQGCPNCGVSLNAAAEAGGDTVEPIPRDITICFSCGAALMFDVELKARIIRPGVWNKLDPEYKADIIAVQNRVRLRGLDAIS